MAYVETGKVRAAAPDGTAELAGCTPLENVQNSSAMNGFKQGDHVCAFYDTEEEQLAVATEYVADGLRRGERCLYVADSLAAIGRFCGRLDAIGIDSRDAIDRGALHLKTKNHAHLVDGHFDSERMLRLLSEAVEEALNDGFIGLRTCGDMSWLLDQAPGSSQVVEYEALLTQFFQNVRAVGMCQYDRTRLPVGLLDHALSTHPTAVVDRAHKHNPFFMPAAMAGNPPRLEELNWKIDELRRRS
jgi:hypothetical protein